MLEKHSMWIIWNTNQECQVPKFTISMLRQLLISVVI